MAHVCTWWHAYTFDNDLRGLFHNPAKIFGPYIKPGMTVLDVGCGTGFTSNGLARLVGEGGRVIAVDLQEQMLDVLERRARKAGVAGRIRRHHCRVDHIGIADQVDFANAFWMVHEVPGQGELFRQLHDCLKPGGKLLLAEPRFHVSEQAFQATVEAAEAAGLAAAGQPRVRFSRAVVFARE